MLKNFDKVTTEGVTIVSNFHTHNYMCGHAEGTVCDYVKQAIKHGYRTIGISDHFASHCDYNSPYITFDTMDGYFAQFDEAQSRYGDKIKILKGVEVAYYSGDYRYYRKLRDKLDYLVLGQHGYELSGKRKNSFWDGNDERNVVAYCNQVITAIKTELFNIFAHPDLIFFNNPVITKGMETAFDLMIQTAVKYDVIVELNANGIRNAQGRYPTDMLVHACLEHNAKVIVSSDCHLPRELYDEYVLRLYAYAKQVGLNVVDEIF